MNKKSMLTALAVLILIAGVFGFYKISQFTEKNIDDDNNESVESISYEVSSANSDTVDESDTIIPTQDIDAFEVAPGGFQEVKEITIPEAIVISDGDIGSFYGNEEFEDVIPVDIRSFSADNIPAKYDSRNVNGKKYVTDVENQGYTSLCWAYAALGAVESDILMHHPDISALNLDLSEKHLAYYNAHRAEGSINGYIDDDYREFVNAEDEKGAWIFDYDTNYVAAGGVANYCISLLTAWKGPVAETGDDAFKSLFGSQYIFEDNYDIPSAAYISEYHVQAVNQICAGILSNTMIKQMIMEHGGVTVGINTYNKFWKGHDLSLYSHFGDKDVPTANHEVLIIGWDDEYSRDNFASRPEADGAWICKNSWGYESGESGIMYLSYYDQTIAKNNAAAYSSAVIGDKDFYDNNYQAAGFLTYMNSTTEDSENYVTAYTEASNPYGMLYKTKGDEAALAIGLMGLETYQQYEICIFVNPKVSGNSILCEELQKPDEIIKASAISGGFHTFTFPNAIKISKGDEVFILIKPFTKGKLVFEEAIDQTSKANYDEWKNLTGNIHNHYSASGCSFYLSADGTKLEKQKDKDFFVKMYTNDR